MPPAARCPAASRTICEFASCAVELAGVVSPETESLLYDPQTSGGLLIALPENQAANLIAALPGAYRIGRVTTRERKPIRLL